MTHDDYSILLYEFVDGTIDQHNEESLFRAMSGSHELRNELKELLTLKGAVQSDVKAFTPPVESTMKIFGTLGYSTPGALSGGADVGTSTLASQTQAGNTVSALLSKSATYLGGYLHALLGGVAITGITLTVLFSTGTVQLSKNDKMLHTKPATQTISVGNTSPLLTNNAQTIEQSRTTTLNNPTPETVTKQTIKYIYVREKANNVSSEYDKVQSDTRNDVTSAHEVRESSMLYGGDQNSSTQQHSKESNYTTPNVTQITDFKNSNVATSYSLGQGIQNQATNTPVPYVSGLHGVNLNEGEPITWSIEMRRMDVRPLDNPVFTPQNNAFSVNAALTALFAVNESLSLGMELGYERFYQSFESFDNQNRRIKIYQQPSLLTGGLAARYAPFNFDGFQPFLQASAGFSQIGMVNRGLLGMRYSPSSSVSFSLGIESSFLLYNERNVSYTTMNYGLSYGFSLTF